jgi:hypothetical protein
MPQNSEIPTGHSVQALYLNNQYKARNGYAVDSGCLVSTDSGVLDDPDTLLVNAGRVWYSQRPLSVASQNVQVDSPGADPRKDVVVINNAGNAEVVKGTPAPIPDDQAGASRFETYNPSPPDLSAQDAVPLCEVWVPGGANDISDADLNDIRAFEGRMMLVEETTVTATTGSDPAINTVIQGVIDRQAQNLNVLVTSAGGTNTSYGYNWDWGRIWDETNGEVDIDLTVTWDDDPGVNVDLDVFVVQMNT